MASEPDCERGGVERLHQADAVVGAGLELLRHGLADHLQEAREILENEIGFAKIYTFEHGEPVAHDF